MALLVLFAGLSATAQNKGIKLTEIIDADNMLHITAEPVGYGSFTLWLTVSETNNVSKSPTMPYEITRTIASKKEVLSFKPENTDKPAKAEYTYDWLNGKVNALPDLGFIYRIPVANGKQTIVRSVTPAQADMGRNNTSNFRVWQFSAEPGEPVFAVRKGVVIRAEDNGRDESGDDDWAGALTVIEHADGTQAIYTGLKGGSLSVKEGNTVLPSQRIGSAGKFFDSTKGVRVGIYSYISNRNKGAYPNMKVQNDFINPLYCTSSGNMILNDGMTVVVKVSSRIINAESEQPLWRRMLSIINLH